MMMRSRLSRLVAAAAVVVAPFAATIALAPTAQAEAVPCSVIFHLWQDPIAWDGTWRNIVVFSPFGTSNIFCEKTGPKSFRAWQVEPNGVPHNLSYIGGSIPAIWMYQP